ncbi:MAG: ferritin [Planctomycetota bacterium]|jgi:ferritin
MLSETMRTALNDQITKELYSSYLYLQMAAWAEDQSLAGFGNWLRVQAQEENAHGMILFNYVVERGGLVELGQIDAPGTDFASIKDIFEKTLAHEEFVTASINTLMDLAITEKDHATKARLDWFVSEQVEEEANASDILGKLKLIGDQGDGLFMIDKEMAARVFNVPSPLAGAEA